MRDELFFVKNCLHFIVDDGCFYDNFMTKKQNMEKMEFSCISISDIFIEISYDDDGSTRNYYILIYSFLIVVAQRSSDRIFSSQKKRKSITT